MNSIRENKLNYSVFKYDFNQILQTVESLNFETGSNNYIFILMRSESFDEFLNITESDFGKKSVYANYSMFLQILESVSKNKNCKFFISNLFSLGPTLASVNNNFISTSVIDPFDSILNEFLLENRGFSYFNVQALINYIGADKSYNKSQDLLFKQPFSKILANIFAESIISRVKHELNGGIKLIATDADGTLWGGIIGEDRAEEIQIDKDYPGSVYYKYQRYLLDKKSEGILLALVSKNNRADIENFFQIRTDMPIKFKDFSLTEVSWSLKSEAIVQIAEKVNIGLESILFIDDSNFEIEAINTSLPEVKTLHLSELIENRVEQLVGLNLKWEKGSTVEDKNRTEMIQANLLRSTLSKSNDSLLKKLDLQIEISQIENRFDSKFTRALQLINKTNQFNLTCKRFTEIELEEFLNKGRVYTASLTDRFGSYGIILLALIEFPTPSSAFFSNVLMSCRAIGRKAEEVFMSEILQKLILEGYTSFEALRIENPKNQQTESFFAELGFEIQNSENINKEQYFVSEKDKLIFQKFDYLINWT
jgi:FkbH-like protein